MRILIVSATSAEIAPLLFSREMELQETVHPRLKTYRFGPGTAADVLTTGVGMTATAYWLGRALAEGQYDAAFNFGICGSFDRRIALGEVVHVTSDRFSETGAQDGELFLSLEDMGLQSPGEYPFTDGRIFNQHLPGIMKNSGLRQVSGITVNTVHGDETAIGKIVQRLQPQVESMEGAAFLYACLLSGVRCAQVRAVSNYVEKRNRAAWKIDAAVRNLNDFAFDLLSHIA